MALYIMKNIINLNFWKLIFGRGFISFAVAQVMSRFHPSLLRSSHGAHDLRYRGTANGSHSLTPSVKPSLTKKLKKK
jgi:hypothetical protein